MDAAQALPGRGESVSHNRFALGTLAAVYLCNLLDRGLMDILAQPIKDDLKLTDTQLGFVTGLAFAFFYAALGLPIARWADRGNRVTISAIAIGLWGITVMASVFVVNYAQLLAARIFAAVGEAGCKPPTYSLVGDYYPEPAARTRAMAIYWLGGPLSALLSYIVGGWLNQMYGWRMTFFLAGIPGLVMAVIVKLTLKDPRSRRNATASRRTPSLGRVLKVLWTRRACRNLTLALILIFTVVMGSGTWNAAFMIRNHGMGTAELGVWLGLINGIGGAISVLLGGYVASRWFGENECAQMRISAFAIALTVPFTVSFLFVTDKYLALMMQIPVMLVLNLCIAPMFAIMQRLVSDNMRATTMAIIMLLYNLIGMGLGPQLVGLISDALKPALGVDSLRYALLLMSLLALWSAYHFWRVGSTVKDDLQTTASEQELDGVGMLGVATQDL